jgi:hypothetical protein
VKSQSNQNIISESKPSISVRNIKAGDHIQNLTRILVKENIGLTNMASNKIKLNNIISSYLKINKISNDEKSRIIEGIIQTLI